MTAHFRPLFSRKGSWLVPAIAFLSLVAGPSADVRAGLTIGIQSVSANAGGFNVYLTNTGPLAVSIDTTQFEITASSSKVNLTAATIYTTGYNYIFANNSLFGPTINTSSGQTLDASDLAASGDVSIASGASVGLGYVSFTLTGTLSAPVTISCNPNSNFTSLADLGNNVPINTFQSGTISLPAAVPEPASLVQATFALALGGLFTGRRRSLRVRASRKARERSAGAGESAALDAFER